MPGYTPRPLEPLHRPALRSGRTPPGPPMFCLMLLLAACDGPMNGVIPESGWTDGVFSMVIHEEYAALSDGCMNVVHFDVPLDAFKGRFAWSGHMYANNDWDGQSVVATGVIDSAQCDMRVDIEGQENPFFELVLLRDDGITDVTGCD